MRPAPYPHVRADTGAGVRFIPLPTKAPAPTSWSYPVLSSFLKTDVCKVSDELGLVFGWGIICKIDGEPYFDLQGDHIPEESMLRATADFMLKSRVSGDMHARDAAGVPIADGNVVFSFPLTEQLAKAMNITSDRTGWMVAVRPSPEVLAKYKSGEYRGFSIGGRRLKDENV